MPAGSPSNCNIAANLHPVRLIVAEMLILCIFYVNIYYVCSVNKKEKMRRNELHITNLIVPVSRKSEPNNYAHTMNTSDYNTVNTLYTDTMNSSMKNNAVTSPALKNTHLSLNLTAMENSAMKSTSVKNTFPESESGIAGSSNMETTAICTVTACKSFAAPSREEHTSMKDGFMKNTSMENMTMESTAMGNTQKPDDHSENRRRDAEGSLYGHVTSAKM